MENILFSLRVVFPFLLYMTLGLVSRRFIQVENLSGILNQVVFKLILPIHLFLTTAKTRVDIGSLSGLYLFAFVAILLIFLVFWFYYDRKDLPRKQKGVLIQASYRSNYILFGAPLGAALLGEDQAGIVVLLIPVVIPMFNLLSIFALSYYGSDDHVGFKGVLVKIAKNPLILGILAGFLWKLTGLDLPDILVQPLQRVGSMATPMALIGLGHAFSFSASKAYSHQLVRSVFIRLLLVPFLTLGAAALLGIHGGGIVALLAVFASPVAISSYAMAEAMDNDGKLAGQILVYTTLLSSLSLFFIIFVLKSLTLI